MKQHYIIISGLGTIRYGTIRQTKPEHYEYAYIEEALKINSNENWQGITPTKENIAQLKKALRGMTQ